MHVHFSDGAQQAQQANSYFRSVANELLEQYLPDVPPGQVIITDPVEGSLSLRLWVEGFDEAEIARQLPWLRRVLKAVRSVADGLTEPALAELMWVMLELHPFQRTLFVEFYDPARPQRDDSDVSIGMVNGRVVLLSGWNVMGVRVDEGMTGLSIDPNGSFLIEGEGHWDRNLRLLRA